MNIIEVMTGEETFRNATVKFYTLVCSTQRPEKHLGVAAREGGCGVEQLSRSQFNAFAGMSAEFGTWNVCRYSIDDGAILKLFGYLSRYGSPRSSGIMYLLAREKAAYRQLSFRLLQIEGKSRYQTAYVKGRFDILDEKEVLKMRMMIQPGRLTRATEENPSPFTHTVIMPEIERRPSVQQVTVTTGKEERVVAVTVVPRRIRLRKKSASVEESSESEG